MGVVVRRYMYIDILTIIINFPYSTCISSFFGSSIPTSFFFFWGVAVNTYVPIFRDLDARGGRKLQIHTHKHTHGTTTVTIIKIICS